jgi:superfamily I DNA/RNA helicase
VKRCFVLFGRRRKAVVKGRDIGQGLVALLEQLAPSPTTPIADFLEQLMTYKVRQLEKLNKAGRDVEAQMLEDKLDTIEVLALGCDRTNDIKGRIDKVFSDADSTGVTFCSIHRSKGLEALRIFVLRPDLLPHPKSTTELALQQEANLKYVAITRSQGELYWVLKEKGER